MKTKVKNKCEKLGVILNVKNVDRTLTKNRTKGDLFSKRANYQSARTAIRKDAQKTFDESEKKYVCIVCKYDKHCEIAHLKGVAEFSDDILVSEINHVDNLVALCPNHH